MVANVEKKKMPKGGRKGGSKFPRHALKDVLEWSRKLVSKTHSGPQPIDIIYSGVVGAKSGHGDVKIAALRQYGLLEGNAKGFEATDLAKAIAASPDEELQPLYKKAALSPAVFRAIFDAYHGDEVSRAKLKQRAADLKVHPDETDRCIDIYVSSASTAALVTADGDKIQHVSSAEVSDLDAAGADSHPGDEVDPGGEQESSPEDDKLAATPDRHRGRASIQVTVTVDSSLDADKLERQLQLLKKYGAI